MNNCYCRAAERWWRPTPASGHGAFCALGRPAPRRTAPVDGPRLIFDDGLSYPSLGATMDSTAMVSARTCLRPS